MNRRIFASLALALLLGCGTSELSKVPVPEKSDALAVSPSEMRMILEGLRSNDPRRQHAALETLSRFPSVVQSYREHVKRLEMEGQDQRLRQKAAELLDSLEK
ncbi:MAG: hypothetical protein ACC628_05020 [Pirellulaceae bacterium]